MAVNSLPCDLNVQGAISCQKFNPPSGCVNDAAVASASSGQGVQATKLIQQYVQVYRQVSTANAAVDRQVVHVVKGATGSVVDFNVGAVTAATGNAAVNFDLLLNGASILSAQVQLTNSTAAYALLAGSIPTPTTSAGGVLEVSIASVNAGTGTLPKGIFARVTVREDAQ